MLRREAAGWLARLQSGRDPAIERRFRQWRDADPRHSAAFDRVQRTYEQAGLLRHVPVIETALREPAAPKMAWRPRPALAAAVAAALLVPLVLLLARSGGFPLGGTEAVMLTTNVGEIRQFDLADGSKVTLDTATKLDVEIGRSGRSAHLRYGRARFQVAKSNSPFVIETATATVGTTEGVIDLAQGARQDRVQLLAGTADVYRSGRRDAPAVALAAGEAVTVGSAGPERAAAAPPARDWTRGMLQFDATRLADAVELANRYSERHIILLGDLGELKVTGAFRAGDTAGLAKALAAAFRLSLKEQVDGDFVLSPRASASPQNKRGG